MVYPVPVCFVHPALDSRQCPADRPRPGEPLQRIRSFFALGSLTCTLRRKVTERNLVSKESR